MLRFLFSLCLGFAPPAANIAQAETLSHPTSYDLPIGVQVVQSSVGYRFLGDNPVRNPEATSYEIFAVFTVEFMALSIAANGQAGNRARDAKPIAENLTSLCAQSYHSVLATVRAADTSNDSPAVKTLTDVVSRFDPERYQIEVQALPQTLETATHGRLRLSLDPYNALFDVGDQKCTLMTPSALKVTP